MRTHALVVRAQRSGSSFGLSLQVETTPLRALRRAQRVTEGCQLHVSEQLPLLHSST